jgi:hypothetical protein
MSKPRLIKDYEKLPEEIKEQIKITYPHGYHKKLIEFKNKEGNRVSALPFETDEVYYMVRMTVEEAKSLIVEDEDYDEQGILKDDIQDEYEDKYSDVEYLEIPDAEGDEEFDEEDEDF